jgi:hypothetical protein
MGYVLDIVTKGRALKKLQLASAPNMLFLYLLAVLGAVLKPKWTNSKTFPALEVRSGGMPSALAAHAPPSRPPIVPQVTQATPAPLPSSWLKSFKSLSAWSAEAPDHVPMMALMAQAFRCGSTRCSHSCTRGAAAGPPPRTCTRRCLC